jgi:hypothetical protein
MPIAFKKIVFEKALVSGLGPFGWEATEREHVLRGMGELEQCLLDLDGQRLKSREVVQMGVLLFDLLPELFNRIVVRRIGRQLDDLKPCCLLGEEGLRLGAGAVIPADDLCPLGNHGSG